MHPLLTFASGLVAGIAGIRLLKSAKTSQAVRTAAVDAGGKARHGLDVAQAGLRGATVSGLTAIERTSANLRRRIEPGAAGEAETAVAVVEASGAANAESAGEPGAEVKATKARRPRKAPSKKAGPAKPGPEGEAAP